MPRIPGQLVVHSIGASTGSLVAPNRPHVRFPSLMSIVHGISHMDRIHTSGWRTGTRTAHPSQSAVEVYPFAWSGGDRRYVCFPSCTSRAAFAVYEIDHSTGTWPGCLCCTKGLRPPSVKARVRGVCAPVGADQLQFACDGGEGVSRSPRLQFRRSHTMSVPMRKLVPVFCMPAIERPRSGTGGHALRRAVTPLPSACW